MLQLEKSLDTIEENYALLGYYAASGDLLVA
jgi:hypothetical protein